MFSQPRTASQVADRIRQGVRVKFLLFHEPEPRPDGSAGRGCLSQRWPAPFTLDGLSFPTAEHHLMWRKAMLFGDHKRAARIMATDHPTEVVRIGRQVAGFDQRTWEAKRFEIAVAGSMAKFSQHPDLRAFLFGTGDRVLVEASRVDPVWGNGLSADDPRARQPDQWPGLNLLGFALMQARAALRTQV